VWEQQFQTFRKSLLFLTKIGIRSTKEAVWRCAMDSKIKRNNYGIDLDLMNAEYGDEIMCAGWNPAIDMMSLQLQLVPAIKQMIMPVDYGMVILDRCLRRMHSYLP
jgi:hypothetical protein